LALNNSYSSTLVEKEQPTYPENLSLLHVLAGFVLLNLYF